MTPRERDTLDTILLHVATFNQRQIGEVCTDRIRLWRAQEGLVALGDMEIRSVELLPTGARCA